MLKSFTLDIYDPAKNNAFNYDVEVIDTGSTMDESPLPANAPLPIYETEVFSNANAVKLEHPLNAPSFIEDSLLWSCNTTLARLEHPLKQFAGMYDVPSSTTTFANATHPSNISSDS